MGTSQDWQLDLGNVVTQLKVANTEADDGERKQPTGGVYVGAGLSPVSHKLAQRICQWEYIDMAELLPEAQLFGVTEDGRQGDRKPTVTDILTWVQCFGIYISVLTPCYPEAIPELITYMIKIVGQAKRFRGKTWVLYDATFRRQAMASGNHQWSEVNGTLHASCYSGEAPSGLGYEICLAGSHTTRECSLRGIEAGSTTQMPPPLTLQGPAWKQLPPSGEVCRLWNENKCRFRMCRHTHVCRLCGGNHPATMCQWNQKPPGPAAFGARSGRQGWPSS